MAQKVNTLPVGVPKVRFSFRAHLLPPLTGIFAMLSVYVLLNLPSFEAQGRYYWAQLQSPRTPAAAVSTPDASPKDSDLIVPAIGVKAPVIYETSTDNGTIAYDLRSGVVHYGSTALPGQKGNAVIFGHSSGVAWAPGSYKFVFTLLDKVHPGQQISLDYQGKRYVYAVTDSQVVAPTDMQVLGSKSGKSQLTLITCTPVGTSKNRLVVHADQIHPDPAGNQPFTGPDAGSLKELPGN
jgi:LPXTG-site transpeptidase (sortase) family protein